MMARLLSMAVATILLAAQQPAKPKMVVPDVPQDLVPAYAAPCWTLKKQGRTPEAVTCFQKLSNAAQPERQAEGAWGLEQWKQASDLFEAALKREPGHPGHRTRMGLLYLQRFNADEAEKLFEEATMRRNDYAPAFYGRALLRNQLYSREAIDFAQKALEYSPKFTEARELLARAMLEDGQEDQSRQLCEQALKDDPLALDAMGVLGTIDLLNHRPTEWFNKAKAQNLVYGGAHYLAGQLLVLNRRYSEAIEQFQQGIAVQPNLWAAHEALGINLMRLGKDEDARRHLEVAYNNGHRSNATTNSLRLMDSYSNFVITRGPNYILKLHKKEDALLRPLVEEQVKTALAVFEKKYGFALPAPLQVEVYPDHEDFAVRTMGMPGLGATGVSFGEIIAMDSPSARKPGAYNWASTLWHEISHAFILNRSRFLVPRWFTEGFSVYEETATYKDWGDRITPDVLKAIRDGKLLPVAEFDRGFIRPSSPGQVGVSYWQAGRAMHWMVERWGMPKMIQMVDLYAQRKATPEIIQGVLGISAEQWDKEFRELVEKEYLALAKDMPRWLQGVKPVLNASKEKQWDEVVKLGQPLIAQYPEYVEPGNLYEPVAEALRELKRKDEERALLQRYAEYGGKTPEALKELARLHDEAGDKAAALRALQRLLWISPVGDEALHRRMGELSVALKDNNSAVRAWSAVVNSNSEDPASAYYHLALALRDAGRREDAQLQVLMALEAAPGYKPAQKLLLELNSPDQK
jgi:cellulose synthase operon protein C